MGLRPGRSLDAGCRPLRDTDEDFPVTDGYGALVQQVAAGVPVSLNTAVKQIILDGNGVRVSTDQGPIEARAVIVSVSTNVLSRGLIDFQPGLPDWKLAAAAAVPLGSDNKVVLQIDRKALGIDEHCSVRIPYPGAPWFNVQTLPFGRDIVSIYMGGPLSAELEAAGKDAAIEAGRQAMIDAFGTGIAGHIGVSAASAWGREPSILGAYGAARPGEANLRADLAKPVEDRIFFCGEATHPTSSPPVTARGCPASARPQRPQPSCKRTGSHSCTISHPLPLDRERTYVLFYHQAAHRRRGTRPRDRHPSDSQS